jgi:undecaprenyl-diphosphatase
MEDLLHALVLGVVQGMTEFVPVSSSGHLVLVPWLLRWQHHGLVFDTTVHLGTLVGVVFYFWHDIGQVVAAWLGGWRQLSWKEPAGRMGWLIIVGTMPAAVAGLLFEEWFESLFGQPNVVAASLIATGLILAVSERLSRRKAEIASIGLASALVIGAAQAAAIVPGISRSGATIAAGLGLGLTRASAARFSFLLSLPIIAAAGLSQLVSAVRGAEAAPSAILLVVGFASAAVSGYLCVRLLLAYLQRGTLYVFSAYCWAFGLLALVLWFSAGG